MVSVVGEIRATSVVLSVVSKTHREVLFAEVGVSLYKLP